MEKRCDCGNRYNSNICPRCEEDKSNVKLLFQELKEQPVH